MLIPNYKELVSLKSERRKLTLPARKRVNLSSLGGHASLFKGRGLNFSEVREYANGDDIRSIDWRVTARTGRAHTKVFTEERERSVYLIVDINSYMEFGTRKTFKSIQAARVAAYIAWRAHDLKDKTGAILFGHIPDRIRILPATRSRKAIWEMFKVLCTSRKPTTDVKIEDALTLANQSLPRGAKVFIISDFFNLTPELEKQLGLLSQRCDVTLVKVTDPSEKSLPSVDQIHFSDPSGARLLVNTSDTAGAERYRQLFILSENKLTEIATKYRSQIIQISTDADVVTELQNLRAPQPRRIT